MEFNSIEKKEEGKFITRYDITYTTVDHKKKVYEMISRNKNLTTQEELSDHPADSVVLYRWMTYWVRVFLQLVFRMKRMSVLLVLQKANLHQVLLQWRR